MSAPHCRHRVGPSLDRAATRRRRSALAVALLSVLPFVAKTAAAQSPSPPTRHFGVSAGGAYLEGKGRDFYEPGFDVAVSGFLPIGAAGFALRGDVSFVSLPSRYRSVWVSTPTKLGNRLVGDRNVVGTTLSAFFEGGPSRQRVRPFLSVGAGVYRVEDRGFLNARDDNDTNMHFGVVYGAGMTFPIARFRGLVEARLHNVFVDDPSGRIYPISVGLLF